MFPHNLKNIWHDIWFRQTIFINKLGILPGAKMTFNLSSEQKCEFYLNFLREQYETKVLKFKEIEDTRRLRDEIIKRIEIDQARQVTSFTLDWKFQFTGFLLSLWMRTHKKTEEDIKIVYLLYCLEWRRCMLWFF